MDWAAVLGVSPQARFAEVRAAYRARVRQAHPDKGGSNAEFQRIKEAFDAASTRTQRRHSVGSIPARDWDVSNEFDAPRRAQREAAAAREAEARRVAAEDAAQKVAQAERGKKRRASDPTPLRRAPSTQAPCDFA